MRVGFVILNYQNYSATINCANTLIEHLRKFVQDPDLDWRILVLDNGSPNESWTRLSNWFECVETICRGWVTLNRNDQNYGYGKGNNIGLRELFNEQKCDVVFVVNSDVTIKWIDLRDLKVLISEAGPACIGVRIIEDGDDQGVIVGGASFCPISFRSRMVLSNEPRSRGVFYISGAFLGFNRQLFFITNGFNETQFLYFEELELFYRVRQMIRRWPTVSVLDEWIVEHSVGGSTGNAKGGKEKSPLTDYYSSRGRILFAREYLSLFILNAVAYNVLLCAQRATRGRWAGLRAIIIGTFHGIMGRGGRNADFH